MPPDRPRPGGSSPEKNSPRRIAIGNHHPRLRIDRRRLLGALFTLDQQFRYTAADLPGLAPPAKKRARFHATSRNLHHPIPPALPPGELSIAFLTDDVLANLHGRFLDDPSTTDVITFDGNADMDSAGEVCVSVDTAIQSARSRKIDFSRELLLYVVHGWLHLAGYDDLRPDRKRRMRAAEARAISLITSTGGPPLFRLA
jgi:probable rRNA maturation factor